MEWINGLTNEQSHFYARPDVPGDGSRRTSRQVFVELAVVHNECKVFLEESGGGGDGGAGNILVASRPKKQAGARNYYSLLFDAAINFPSRRIDSTGRAETRERFTWATRSVRINVSSLSPRWNVHETFSIRSPLSPFAMWAHARGTREHARAPTRPRFADSPIETRLYRSMPVHGTIFQRFASRLCSRVSEFSFFFFDRWQIIVAS